MRLLFGEYAPDQPAFQSKFLKTASGVYPLPQGYRPAKQFVATTSALSDTCLGGSAFVSPQGGAAVVAGTATGLFREFANGWQTLGTGYNGQGDDRWRFAQFGGLAVATNGTDAMVKIDLTTFEVGPLGGSPPKAKMLAVVKDFLVAGQINGDINTLGWSGINNAEQWTFGVNQSDLQILPSGGEINGIFGGEFGLVLQRNRITRMSYVGGNTLFQFDEISSNIGCVTVHSVVQSGNRGFFYSDTGFQMWDGAQLEPIGEEKVNRAFAGLYNRASWHLMSAAIDPQNNVVAWSMGDQLFLFNYVLKRWTILPVAAQIIFSGVSKDTSLDELDVLYGNLDSVPVSLDDESFKGGDPRFYVFATNRTMGALSGATMEAIIGMGDVEMGEGRSRWKTVRPLTDATSGMTLALDSRIRMGDTPVSTSYTSLTTSGLLKVRENGKITKPTLTIAAGTTWTYIQGLDATAAPGGRR